jgi:hypothetical protein
MVMALTLSQQLTNLIVSIRKLSARLKVGWLDSCQSTRTPRADLRIRVFRIEKRSSVFPPCTFVIR